MKKILNLLLIGLIVVTSSSCKKFLDINENPNDALTATPELILPQAITATANQMYNYNIYGGQTIGYYANGGGVSGWGSIITYNYTTTDYQVLWNTTYDILNDFEYVLKDTEQEGNEQYAYYNAIAKIMKAYNFQLLVDTYNDAPYSEAFQGNEALAVGYDDAATIYKNITDLVDQAFNTILEADDDLVLQVGEAQDPMFGGDMLSWAQFAQSLKLKLIIRGGDKVSFSNKTFDESIGFLEDDAIVNPGYAKIDGKQNRLWNNWAYNAAGTRQTRGGQYIPTPYILGFYSGDKISDNARGTAVYKAFSNGSAPTNQLGYEGSDAERGENPNSWFKGTSSTSYSELGIFKGYDAGQPLMLAAEVYLNKAEAVLKGIISGDAKEDFENGITASFAYLYKDAAGSIPSSRDFEGDAEAYLTANANNPLVNFSGSNEQKLEAIITQKYIAYNMIMGHEAWNDYRRTGYPKTVANPQGNAVNSMVSLVSQASTPDRLPTRLLYPESEFKYNSSNVITIDPNKDKIFWAK